MSSSHLACLIPQCWDLAKLCFCAADLLKLVREVWEGDTAAAGEMQHWEELVPNSWGSESWDFGPLCLDVLDQKAHKSMSSEMRTCDVTFALDRLIFGMKKRSRFLTTVLSCDNALFVSILLCLLASINSERRNCSFTVWEMSINNKHMCIYTVYTHIQGIFLSPNFKFESYFFAPYLQRFFFLMLIIEMRVV